MKKYKIVVIDSEKNALAINHSFEKEGIHVSMLHLDGGGWHASYEKPSNLVMLDFLLPVEAGLSAFQKMLSLQAPPLLFLAANADDKDQLLGLEIGVRDYLCRLSLPREMLIRIKAGSLGDHAWHAEKRLVAGPLVVDITRHRATVFKSDLYLTPIEFDLLKLLISEPETVVTRNRVMAIVYETDGAGSHRAIDSHISNLRKKIARHLPGQTIIRTVYGSGYSLRIPH
jgi:DNA-binding response OmpR family regulator